MRIIILDAKNKLIKAVAETLDDLWHLEQTIETGDLVSGKTDRKIKGKEEQQKSERITLFIKIEAENPEFHRFSEVLRVNGTIVEAKPQELAPLKSHHTLEIALGEPVTIEKKEWKEHQIQRLKKARDATHKEALGVCVLDEETATIAILKEFSFEQKATLHSGKSGKRFLEDAGAQNKYFDSIIQKLKELKTSRILIAGPGFSKENLQKRLKEKSETLAQHLQFESTNSTGVTGLNELLKSGALEKMAQETQVAQDARLMEQFLKEIATETGMAVYGTKEVKHALEMGAVKEILALDKALREKPQETHALLFASEQQKANIHILRHDTEPGKKLDGFGQIVALLKFRLKWN